MHLHICALLATLLTLPAWAEQNGHRLCVRPVAFEGDRPIAPFTIHAVSASDVAENYIFSLGDPTDRNTLTGFIRGDRFLPLAGRHPVAADMNDIYATGSGQRIGIFGFIGEKEFWQQDRATGEFTRMLIQGFPDEAHIRTAGWSTPMTALLVARGGSGNWPGADVFALRDNVVHKVEGIDEWVTSIVDFPEINMTLLGTEAENRVYLIDANQRIHDLGPIEPREWVFINDAVLLPNPYRLLIDMKEALGSFKGRFLVRLEQRDGVWVPARDQDFRDVFADFDEVSDVGLTGVAPDRLAGLAGFGAQLGPSVPGPGQTKIHRGNSVAIYLPAPDAYVTIGNGQIKAFDIVSGDELGIAGARIDVSEYFPSTNAVYLTDRAELLIAAENGYFILNDNVIDGASACR